MSEQDINAAIDAAEPLDEQEKWLSQLGQLRPIEYDRAAKAAAKKLGVSKQALDEEMKLRRSKQSDGAKEKPAFLQEVDPWPHQVEGEALLESLIQTFRRYAILPEHADIALSLWVMFTWCIDATKIAPLMAIISPEKQCGKTTVLSLLTKLSCRALPSSNITSAALFRVVDKHHPTLLIDEADTFIKDNDELRGVLNSGHSRASAYVMRTSGDQHEPTHFKTWGAKAIAMIGNLPETLHDRSIVIELRRRLPGEVVEKLRNSNDAEFDTLKRQLVRFANDHLNAIGQCRPFLPESIADRAADNWEPLLAIAKCISTACYQRTLEAACILSAKDKQKASIGTQLLSDIRALFEQRSDTYFTSKELIELLCEDEEAPWPTYYKGKPILQKQIARLLREYDICSQNIRTLAGKVQKGYRKEQFEDAFSRYLAPPEFAVHTLHPAQNRHHRAAPSRSRHRQSSQHRRPALPLPRAHRHHDRIRRGQSI